MFSSHCELKGGNMNRKLFIKIIKVTVLMMALFFMFIILNLNTSFAYINHGINYVDITGNASEFFDSGIPNAPIQGIRVQLSDKNTGQPIKATLTDINGDYILEDVPEGNYSLEYRYGDISVLDEFDGVRNPLYNADTSKNKYLTDNLDKTDILKYNGHDYIVSDTQEEKTDVYQKLDKNSAQIFFVIDISGSMKDPIANKETGVVSSRLEVVKDAAKQLSNSILEKNKELHEDAGANPEIDTDLSSLKVNNLYIGLVSFDSDPHVATFETDKGKYSVTQDPDVLNAEIDKLQPGSNTQVSKALDKAKELMFDNLQGGTDGVKIIIFLSDGLPTEDYSLTEASITNIIDSDIKFYSLLIVEDAMEFDKLENLADLEEEKFKKQIDFDESEDISHEIFDDEPFNPGPNYYINNWYFWYTYHGYLNKLYELYAIKNENNRMVFKEKANDLAACMTGSIKSWIEEKIEEFENNGSNTNNHDNLTIFKPIDDGEPERGWENETRRYEVDSYFSDIFHNNTSTDPTNLSAQSYLFKTLDNINSVSEDELKNFSNNTYMIVIFDITIQKSTTVETFNLCLKRRNEFSLKVSNKVIAAKVTLNTGQVVYKKFDESYNYDDINRKPYLFFKDIDSELLHGALIELEYRVYIENLSPNIACTYLDLVSYLPPGLYFSENSQLLSNKYSTNYDTGWNLDEKSDLLKLGYLVHDDTTLINRNYIITYSHPVNIAPRDSFETNFVLSTYITNVDDFALYREPNEDKDIVEIFGYRNSKNRRMEFRNGEDKEETYTTVAGETAKRATFTSVYPGDGDPTAPDYSLDYNYEGINPVTGKKQNYTIYVIYLIIIILSNILIILKIKLKK